MMCWIFFRFIRNQNFFSYYPFFSKILGPPFHLEALGNFLIVLVEGSTLVAVDVVGQLLAVGMGWWWGSWVEVAGFGGFAIFFLLDYII